DVEVIGDTDEMSVALETIEAEEPDVVLLDIQLAGRDGLDAVRQIHRSSPRTAVIMLTNVEDEEQLFQSIKVGAAAYYLKTIEPKALVTAVKRVSHGEFLINDDVLRNPPVA